MEWWQWYTAQVHKKYWENFATWPYGMVYKHIDNNGNLLKRPVPFKEWERTSQKWALDNAKAYYNKKAAERSKNLKAAWCKYNQNQLDALVSASWWTVKSYERLKNFVISHWNNLKEVFEFLKTFARRDSKWNLLWWLIARRNLEADYFMWDTEKTYRDYQREYQLQKKKKA
jgi:GH24 family phage-related lysozyme (muramidase)